MKKVISFDAIDPTAAERAKPVTSDQEYIDELAEAYTSQCELPPLDVFQAEKGAKTYFLADGLRRMTAAKKAGLNGHECEIHDGDYEDALLFSAGANNRHGARPTPADKFKKVRALLQSKRWKGKSDRWIGDTCGVSYGKVKDIRAELSVVDSHTCEDDGKREGKDGKRYKAKSGKGKGAYDNGDGEPEAGEEIFDFALYNSARGTLRKLIDRMYRMHKLVNSNGSIRQDADWDEIAKCLERYHELFAKRWAYLHGTPFPKQ